MEMHFASVWESIADAIPDHVAITHGDTSRTWAEFDDRSARIAQAYTDAGLGPDSKIALYMYNCNEYMEAHNAAFKMRGVAVNVNYRYLDEGCGTCSTTPTPKRSCSIARSPNVSPGSSTDSRT